jgi:hypothetical protein
MTNVRRKDELLRCIHHARNSEEHGLAEGTATALQGEVLLMLNPFSGEPIYLKYKAQDTDNPPRDFMVTNTATGEQKPAISQTSRTYLKVVRVHDEEHGDSFDPPTLHLGKPFTSDDPAVLAEAALEYLERLVSEAAKYVAR